MVQKSFPSMQPKKSRCGVKVGAVKQGKVANWQSSLLSNPSFFFVFVCGSAASISSNLASRNVRKAESDGERFKSFNAIKQRVSF